MLALTSALSEMEVPVRLMPFAQLQFWACIPEGKVRKPSASSKAGKIKMLAVRGGGQKSFDGDSEK